MATYFLVHEDDDGRTTDVYQIFCTSDSNQMCYYYQKLEICENFGSGSGTDLSQPIRGSE